MKTLMFLLTATLYCSLLFSQTELADTDTTRSVYKDLPVINDHPIKGSLHPVNNGWISVNGVLVKRNAYTNKQEPLNAVAACKPCIFLFHGADGKLLSKSIKYTDAFVGYYIEYYPNGKAKVIGHYKENPTNDWNNLWERGYGRKDGAFTYFDDGGKKLYAEYWQNDQFIKQVPEQKKTEIWNIDITLNGNKIDTQAIDPEQIKNLQITPRYKNSSTEGINLTIKVEVYAMGHKIVSKMFSPDNFNTVDVPKMLMEAGITLADSPGCNIFIYNNIDANVRYQPIKLRPGN